MEGSIECLPGEDIDEVCRQFEDYLLEVARQDPWMKDHPPKIVWFGLRFEAGQTPIDNPLVQRLSEAAKFVTGTYPKVVGGGGTDLRLPVLYADSPSVLFGPTGSPIHTTDEYIEIESVVQVAQILARFILEWCEEVDHSKLG
jgi:acetylornithine deacetylase